MTDTTSATTAPPTEGPHRRARRWVMTVGLLSLAVLVAVVAWGLITVVLPGHRSFSYTADTGVAAGGGLRVETNNAAVTLAPSPDGQVHITAQGTYTTTAPTVGHSTAGDTTTITASCASTSVNRCSLDVQVLLPAALAVTADAGDGQFTARDLTGPLNLTTSNGTIQTERTTGALALHTTNGTIDVASARSPRVSATTQNGTVTLGFAAPPTAVQATTTNGVVDIAVPPAAYYITTHTTNGGIQTELPSDRYAAHTITATTSNGGIRVHPTNT